MNKRQVARVLGATVVGAVRGYVVTRALGKHAGVVGALAVAFFHEALNAPVSNGIYKLL